MQQKQIHQVKLLIQYFDLSYHLTKENNINLICLITPKSSFWRNGLIIEGNGKKWNNVIDSLKLRDVTIWNYENLFDEKVPNNYFANEDHSTLDGANIFTQIIVEKLKDQSLEKDYFEP